MLRILIVHNSYQQKGGEDSVVDNETALLKACGHQVELYLRHNNELHGLSKLSILKQAVWSKQTSRDLHVLLQQFKPNVIHVHNTLSVISPSLYWAAAKLNIPVVQTLHNFRLLCPQAMFLRKGKVCESCMGRGTWRSVIYRCYRSSASQSAVISGIIHFHRRLGTYRKNVSRYIALNTFCKDKFIEGGLPESKICIKPNFVADVIPIAVARNGFLFVGRLSAEKGLRTLMDAFNYQLHGQLSVVGGGEDFELLRERAEIKSLGVLASNEVNFEMQRSCALVLPSIWYENMPMTLVESFMNGLPIIASNIGALAELVEDGVTGLLFTAGDANDLSKKMKWAIDHPELMLKMGGNARNKYLSTYCPEVNIKLLVDIYHEAISSIAIDGLLVG
jgi:glycosyltransferase involved in cell wall biosynthesis